MAGATIVFCDIVGFSQHNNDRQRELIYALNAEVTHELYAHLSAIVFPPPVIALPTGDGIAIALLDHEPGWTSTLFSLVDRLMRWAGRESKLRIGVHTGPVSLVADINRRPNVCGATINVCQRVMDAAHPNQVLFSDTAYIQYVGQDCDCYKGKPFSEDASAMFKGPFNVVAKHGLKVPVHIMYRQGDASWSVLEPFPRGMIFGKIPRTDFIVDRLESLLCRSERKLVIYEQSAFSTFGISEEQSVWQPTPDFSEEFFRLVVCQRQLLDQLARMGRISLKLIVNPMRANGTPGMRSRFDILLKWMTESRIIDDSNIDFVEATYAGPNRLIVVDEFSIEGFKLHDMSGYEMSIVHTDKQGINEAISAFDRVFCQAKDAGQKKQTVIDRLQNFREKCPPTPTVRANKAGRRSDTPREADKTVPVSPQDTSS